MDECVKSKSRLSKDALKKLFETYGIPLGTLTKNRNNDRHPRKEMTNKKKEITLSGSEIKSSPGS